MTQKTNQNPWTMDVRVRERNLKSGALTDKDLEKYLAGLPDLAEQAEPFGTPQPALAQQPPAVEAAAPVEELGEQPQEHVAEEPQQFQAAPQPEPPQQVEAPAATADAGADGSFTNGEGQQP